jgi:hypothetical protein
MVSEHKKLNPKTNMDHRDHQQTTTLYQNLPILLLAVILKLISLANHKPVEIFCPWRCR